MQSFFNSFFSNQLTIIFMIALLGYLLGCISIKGVSLGTSGILIIALIFGHFGLAVPSIIRNLGLIIFVTSVGVIAGPVFFKNFKAKATAYIILGLVIVLTGAVIAFTAVKLLGIPSDLACGLFTGAMTSTPGLASAIEIFGDNAATGYGIAYPFGVIGVVLFVQLLPRILKTDIPAEVREIEALRKKEEASAQKKSSPLFVIEKSGLAVLALAMVLGMLIACIVIPLPGGMTFSLGTSGGPLLAGLLVGHFRKAGRLSLEISPKVLETMRELGLMLFLMGAGTQAGEGFVEVLRTQGARLFLVGIVMTLLPMVVGYILARYAFKVSTLNSLGAITGGMTSTPALGALINTAGSDVVAASYAATYPVALISVVISTQLLNLLL